MNVGTWVNRNPQTVQAGEPLGRVVQIMDRLGAGALLVLEGERLVGIFTGRDLVKPYFRSPAGALDRPISEFMTGDPVTAQVSEDDNSLYTKMQTHGVSTIPILDGERVVGMVSARDLIQQYQARLETEFQETRRRIEELERIAHLSSDEKLRTLMEEIDRYRELSATDPLTGLYNKRTFASRLVEEMARAARYKSRLSLVFCDIDHFKRINDSFGHAVGDLVLQQVAAILSGSRLRKSDIVARYGGEEFVAILPETGAEGAAVAAENLRSAVAERRFAVEGYEVRITASFGVAEYSQAMTQPEDLIRNADTALYRAKDRGRNRVELFVPGG
jgi:diguanylate cyclase (GGDEF)-like protein